MKALILSISTGQGHHATGQAVESAFRKKGFECHTLDAYEYIEPLLSHLVSKGYLFSTAYAKKISSKVYDLVVKKNNELNNFVLPVVVSEIFLQELFDTINKNHKAEVKVDLPNQTVTNLATGHFEHFDINSYKKHCLENGLDDVDFLVQNRDKVEAWETANK